MLMIIVAVDDDIKLGEMGRVGVPSCVGSHQQFRKGRIIVQLVCHWLTSVKIRDNFKTL